MHSQEQTTNSGGTGRKENEGRIIIYECKGMGSHFRVLR